jgi:hypothetical protein
VAFNWGYVALVRINAMFAAALAAAAVVSTASSQVRVMNYNIARQQGSANALVAVIAAAHSDNKVGWAKPVDLMFFQEVPSSQVAALQSLVNAAAPLGATYLRATYTSNSQEDSASGAQCAFYRVETISEITSGHADIFTGAGRACDRWLFSLNGYSSSAARLYAYSMHLAAGTSAAATRESGALAVRSNANGLGAGVRAFYVGDFNVYSNGEAAYLAFLASGNGQAFDPLGTGGWGGSSNAIKHTQSPRDIQTGLVGGGMDDRFDLHLATAQLLDNEGLSIISGTYRAFGNDGQHYNVAISAGGNNYFVGESARSNALAQSLFDASDHIPVLVDYQVPAVMSAIMTGVPQRVIQGASVPVTVRVKNVAPVVTPIGADELDYSITSVAGLFGSGSGVAPLAPSEAVTTLQLNTGSVGLAEAQASAWTLSEAAQNSSVDLISEYTVISRARPSWAAGSIVTTTSIPVSVPQGGAAQDVDVPLHNVAWTTLQSRLDADFVSLPSGAPVSVVAPLPSMIAQFPGTLRLRVNPAGLPVGLTSVNGTLLVTDEDVPGEGDGTLLFTVAITVNGSANPADLNGDQMVNALDLAIMLSQWGNPGSADLDGSGSVDGPDLAQLLGAWG